MKSAAKKPEMIISDQTVKLMASEIFQQLQSEGCDSQTIISVSSQLLGLVTEELQKIEVN